MVFQPKLDRNRIIAMHDRGMTVKSIAEQLGYDNRYVGKKLIEWGIRVPQHQRKQIDIEAQAIANVARSGKYCAYRLSKLFRVSVEEVYEVCNLRKIELPEPTIDAAGLDEESTLKPCKPTKARPGTLEKLEVLQRRLANGEQLWHDADPTLEGWTPTREWTYKREATFNRNRV